MTTATCYLAAKTLMCLAVRGAELRDRFGGSTSVRGRSTGFYHTERIDGRWWLITAEGNAFFSNGSLPS
jgi:hypothetical protein